MQNIVYLHGLNSTHRSFNYLIQNLPKHGGRLINYDSHQPLKKSIEEVAHQLPKTGKFSIVGHSLGGVIGAIIANAIPNRIERFVAIASPFKGSISAATLRWLPGSPSVIGDIVPNGPFIRQISSIYLDNPTLSIIATAGNLGTVPQPNDGVIALSSQRALQFGEKIEIEANHFEILTHEDTAKVLKNFLFS